MKHVARYALLTLIAALMIAFTIPVGADVETSDVQTTWARSHIESLMAQGILHVDEDGRFRPNDPLTRAEFAQMASAALFPTPKGDVAYTDIDGHEARRSILSIARAGVTLAAPGGAFEPDRPMTRAELVVSLMQLMEWDDVSGLADTPSFSDVPPEHPAFAAVEAAALLKLLPPYFHGTFQPALTATRAEAAAMLNEILMLQKTAGRLESASARDREVTLRFGEETHRVHLLPESVVVRNNVRGELSGLQEGDAITVIADRFGSPRMLLATGLTEDNAPLESAQTDVKGILLPSDIRAIIAGDWEHLSERAKSELVEALVQNGLDPDEAAALTNRDWEAVQEYGRSHLAQLIGARLGISPELAHSLIDGDWDRLKEYAQDEVLANVLNEWLASQAG